MNTQWTLNFGNLFYLIEELAGIGQVELSDCITDLNKTFNSHYDFNNPNYCKMKRCERNMYSYVFSERANLVNILCNRMFRNELVRIKLMNGMLAFCSQVASIDEKIIDKLSEYQANLDIQGFILYLFEVANSLPNTGDSLFKNRVKINELLLKHSTKIHENHHTKSYTSKGLVNAPTSRFSDDFVERKEKYIELHEALYKESNHIIYVYGDIDSGKTTITSKFFADIPSDYHKFWFGAKLRPDELRLDNILSEVLKSFNYTNASISGYSLAEKKFEAAKLLDSKYVFFFNNFEKSEEQEMTLDWIISTLEANSASNVDGRFVFACDMPRDYFANLYTKYYPFEDPNKKIGFVHIPGMNKSEIESLIKKRLKALPILSSTIKNNKNYINKFVTAFATKTTAGPALISISLAYIEHLLKSGHDIDSIFRNSELFEFGTSELVLFQKMWDNVFDIDTKKVISTIALIPKGLTIERIQALTKIPNVQVALDTSVNSFVIDFRPSKRADSLPVYTKHDLVIVFIKDLLKKCPIVAEINELLTNWYRDQCENFSYYWASSSNMTFIHEEFSVIYQIIKRADGNEEYETVIKFMNSLKYFILAKNMPSEDFMSTHQATIEHLDDIFSSIEELTFNLNILNADTSYTYLHQDCVITNFNFTYNHALALFYYSQKFFSDALAIWKRLEQSVSAISTGEMNTCLKYIAKCYKNMDDLCSAKKYFAIAAQHSKENGFVYNEMDMSLSLIEFEIVEIENNYSNRQPEKTKLILDKLSDFKDTLTHLNKKIFSAKWGILYAKALRYNNGMEYFEEIMKSANNSYQLYGEIHYKGKQQEINKWISVSGANKFTHAK